MGKKKILLVEDEFFLAENIRNRLEFAGYDLSYAENGEEALAMLERQPCDLVILDVMMPVMDGIETAKRIRSHKKIKNLPILFLTVKARPQDREEAMSVGGTDFMTKPFSNEALVAMVEECLKK